MKAKSADFPDWFGPMLVKELRQGLKARGFVLSFVAFQLVLVGVMIFHVLLYSRAAKEFDPSGLTAIFWLLIGAQLLVITPLRALNELATERKANTLELIFMSGLTARGIALGKWVSLLFQALLFVLAVLPYAILRYYFGGVNLTEDLQAMGVTVIACGVLSAVALAISGLPQAARLGATVMAIFLLLWAGPMLAFGFRSPMSGMMFSGTSGDVSFWLVAFDALVVGAIALEVGAATVAPLAENHAGTQRFLTLLAWGPVPFMIARKAGATGVAAQIIFFALLCALVAWQHLSAAPVLLKTHCRPFAGWRGFAGLPFLPGWPSAVVFVITATALSVTPFLFLPARPHGSDFGWIMATMIMGGAALLSGALLWVGLRRRARRPLAEQTIFLVLCGSLALLLGAAEPPGVHLGERLILAVLPGAAMFGMHDQRNASEWVEIWCSVSLIAFGVYASVLLALSWKYWARYFSLCSAVKSTPARRALESTLNPSA